MVITNLISRVKVASAMSNALVSQNIHENAYNFPIKFTVITLLQLMSPKFVAFVQEGKEPKVYSVQVFIHFETICMQTINIVRINTNLITAYE